MPDWLFTLGFGECPAFTVAGPAQDESLEALYQNAVKAQAAGDLKTATEKYVRIVGLRPDLAEAHANLGRLIFSNSFQKKPNGTSKRLSN
jgi:hypothetical protein